MFLAVDARGAVLGAAMALVLLCSSPGMAQAPAASVRLSSDAGPLVLTERGSEGRARQFAAFTAKWGDYVARVYGIEPALWKERLAADFADADPQNVWDALNRPQFDLALASLRGYGHRLEATLAPSDRPAPATMIARLGDVAADMVYSPLVPCRIVDTRLVANGRLAANTPKLYRAVPTGGVFTAQGGAASDCGMTGQAPGAVALNVTMVAPDGAGYATVYPSGSTAPVAASLNYTAGSIVNNSVLTAVPDPSPGTDFAIVSFAASDVVIDIIGYFDTPEATPIECVETATQTVVVAGFGTSAVTPAACGAGYTSISANCVNPTGGLVPIAVSVTSCSMYNPTINALNLDYSRTCCRVPGR